MYEENWNLCKFNKLHNLLNCPNASKSTTRISKTRKKNHNTGIRFSFQRSFYTFPMLVKNKPLHILLHYYIDQNQSSVSGLYSFITDFENCSIVKKKYLGSVYVIGKSARAYSVHYLRGVKWDEKKKKNTKKRDQHTTNSV